MVECSGDYSRKVSRVRTFALLEKRLDLNTDRDIQILTDINYNN